ncbi:hydrolase family 16 [Rhizoctonia solani]|uniref:Hydrolase family 16 n=1 Tax=Rhizoctonia solani TaxID=456999 RepID=A0A8H7M0R4_9AGAM|nr:hydrolase family 16 [Rhizoctonia solani]
MIALSFITLAISSVAHAATYGVTDTFIGSSFLSGFNHEAIVDPTHGRVNASGAGRNSVRIISKKQWDNHVQIMDVRHMPQGCGTWPAYWTTSSTVSWPSDGEIDIIEGSMTKHPMLQTLHTTLVALNLSLVTRPELRLVPTANWQVNSNTGCGVRNPLANSYGPQFNANGGGWYAMERTKTYIKVWFWPRNSATVPAQVKNGSGSINTSSWGTPFAAFVNSNYVNNNPSAFKNAYWDIAALRVYQ